MNLDCRNPEQFIKPCMYGMFLFFSLNSLSVLLMSSRGYVAMQIDNQGVQYCVQINQKKLICKVQKDAGVNDQCSPSRVPDIHRLHKGLVNKGNSYLVKRHLDR